MILRTTKDYIEAIDMAKNLSKAFVDEKDITTDWIEDIYNGDCIKQGRKYVGFYQDEVLVCKCTLDEITWTFPSCEDSKKRRRLLKQLAEQLDRYNEGDFDIISFVKLLPHSVGEVFYFKEEDV